MAAEAAAIFKKSQDLKYGLYQGLVQKLYKEKDCDGLLALTRHLFEVEGNDQNGRTYITLEIAVYLIKMIGGEGSEEEDQMDLEDLLPLTEKIVEMCRKHADEFPDALMHAIELVANLYHAEEEMSKAAFARTSFKFEKYRHCSASDEKKVEWYIETAELWLGSEETGSAGQAIRKAHGIVNGIKDKEKLTIRFKLCYARVLDSERKFLEAAMHYKQISQSGVGVISQKDIMTTLEKSVNCAILAKAGPSRSRVLAILFSDERSKQLPNYPMLEKIFKEEIIRDYDVKQFEDRLSDHHKAETATGRTVLQNSIIQHNMLAASRIYTNIKFTQLGDLLGIPVVQAETLASTMIEQGQMTAAIDQVEGVVEFMATGDGQTGASAGSLVAWDGQIQETCVMVNHILESIQHKHPQYAVE